MGTRAWLEKAIASDVLPTLTQLEPTLEGIERVKTLVKDLRSSWGERGSVTLTQQQSLMDRTRRAIKDHFGEDHFSLDYINFSTDEYIELNNLKQGRVQERNEEVKYIDDPDAIINKAIELLSSREWSEVAAGLAVVTGRRSSEILSTAKFVRHSDWSVTFTGALKRRGETQILSFEIPTLAPSHDVIQALEYVRSALPDAQLMDAKTVNNKYGPSVIGKCDRHFEGLVPLRDGKDNLYTHLFRSVYATIATFWYCPPSVNDVEFKAAIQGHYQIIDESNSERRRSLAASRHYSDYEIADAVIALHDGKRKGIKLNCPGVSIIEPFKKSYPAPSTPSVPKKHLSTLRIFKESKPLLEEIYHQLGLDKTLNQAERFLEFLHWAAKTLSSTDGQYLRETSTDSITTSYDNAPIAKVQKREQVELPNQLTLDVSYNASSDTRSLLNNALITSTATPNTERPTSSALGPTSFSTPPDITQPSPTSTGHEEDLLCSSEENFNPIKQEHQLTPTQLESEKAGSYGLESKLDKLIDVLTLFVSSQIQASQTFTTAGSPHEGHDRTQANRSQSTTPTTKPPFIEPTAQNLDRGAARRDHDDEQDLSKTTTTTRNNPIAITAINTAIDSIIAHNNQTGLPHDLKWAITINAVKELVSEVTKSQRLVEKIISDRFLEIEAHHTSHQIDPTRHNHRHKRKRKIVDIIAPATSRDSSSSLKKEVKNDIPDFVREASRFLTSNDWTCKLTGVIALTGVAPDDLLKHFVFKRVGGQHLIFYTLQLHSPTTPFLELVTLVDAALIWDAIAQLKTHPELKPYLDTHTGQQINAYVRERIADHLRQLGFETYSIAIEHYQTLVTMTT